MADFGLDTELGFILKRLADIQASMQESLIQVTDPINGETLQVDFDEDDPFVNLLNSFADELTEVWEALESVYQQFQPSLASGQNLAGLVQFNNLTKKKGTPSTAPVTVTGLAGTTIPDTFQVTDFGATVIWQNRDQAVIPVGGSIELPFDTQDNGVFNAGPNELNQILTATPGITSAVNLAAATIGTVDETDEELRIRRNLSTEVTARAIPESIAGSIWDIEGVSSVRVFVNNTQQLDSRGIPPKSVACTVVGGDDETIARSLFYRVGLGVQTIGNTSFEFTDLQGEPNALSFYRPVDVPIEMEIDLEVIDTATYNSDGGASGIADAVVEYATGGAGALGINTSVSGFDAQGFPPGINVAVGRLYTPVNSVRGHIIREIRISRDGDPLTTADVDILYTEKSSFASSLITVNEV